VQAPPRVRITAPDKPDSESKTAELEVAAEADSVGDLPVTRLRLLLDGRPYPNEGGDVKLAGPKLGRGSARRKLQLDPGPHLLQALAYTEQGYGLSEAVRVRYIGGGITAGDELLPELYVVAVGISDYGDKNRNLDYAHLDARAVAEAYQTQARKLH